MRGAVHRDISGGLGMPARTSSLTLPELSAVPGISGIYRSERLAILRFHTEAEPDGERKDPEVHGITVNDLLTSDHQV